MSNKYLIFSTLLLALTGCAKQGEDTGGLPWWGWLILVLALIMIVWLICRSQRKEEVDQALLEPNDLTMIEGIGPKIQSVLHAAGIKTFAQLAQMAPEKIKELITEAGIRLGVTDTWPKQAKLAAEGKMEELKTLQDKLQGGREA